jgi:DNA-binding beta-propeller fold protein YncE
MTAIWSRVLTIAVAALALSACFVPQKAGDAATPTSGPQDYYLYVTAESADEVYKVKFDGEKASIVKVIEVGYQATEIEGPHGLTVSLDGKHWFLTMAHGKPFGILYKYSTKTDRVVAQTELGLFPATMQISHATGLLYCVNFDLHGKMGPSSVSIVDPDKMVEVARTKTGPMPHGSRLSPDGRKHYSCAMMSGELFEIDAMSFDVTRKLQLAAPEAKKKPVKGPTKPVKVVRPTSRPKKKIPETKPTWVHPHPTLPRVYVCLNGAAQIAEVDLEKWKVIRRFKTDKGPYNADITSDGKKLLVSYKSAQGVGIWDLEKGVELARIPTARKITHGVVLSPDGRYGFVSSEGIGSEKGTLDVFDMRKNTKVTTLELGLQAGGITFWKTVPRGQ